MNGRFVQPRECQYEKQRETSDTRDEDSVCTSTRKILSKRCEQTYRDATCLYHEKHHYKFGNGIPSTDKVIKSIGKKDVSIRVFLSMLLKIHFGQIKHTDQTKPVIFRYINIQNELYRRHKNYSARTARITSSNVMNWFKEQAPLSSRLLIHQTVEPLITVAKLDASVFKYTKSVNTKLLWMQ